MPTFLITMSWTDQGIRNIKDAPKRAAAARETAKKLGVEIKETYVTTGESDLLSIVESASGDNVASSAWRSARKAMCAPAPCGPGRRPTTRNSYPNCRNWHRFRFRLKALRCERRVLLAAPTTSMAGMPQPGRRVLLTSAFLRGVNNGVLYRCNSNYRRGHMVAKRHKLMSDWEGYCNGRGPDR
jgi:hypothetical protein